MIVNPPSSQGIDVNFDYGERPQVNETKSLIEMSLAELVKFLVKNGVEKKKKKEKK